MRLIGSHVDQLRLNCSCHVYYLVKLTMQLNQIFCRIWLFELAKKMFLDLSNGGTFCWTRNWHLQALVIF